MAATAYNFWPNGADDVAQLVVYGVQDTLSGYILQDVTITEDVNTVQIPDQTGDIAQVISLQRHWTISFTAIGPNTIPLNIGTQQFTHGSDTLYYHVNSVERRATYNDTQKWAVTMEAWYGAVDAASPAHRFGPSES